MKKMIILFWIVILTHLVFAQDYQNIPDIVDKVGTAAGNWLKMETNIRAIGMGGAFVAAADGVGSIPFNPAGIAYMTGTQTYYQKTNYIADIGHNVIAYGTRLSSTDYFGFHLFYLDSGPIEKTTEYMPDGTGEDYNFGGLAFSGTYARVLTDRLKVGLTIKYIREHVDNMYYQTFAFDLGSSFRTGIYGFTLGMCVSNFGPEVRYNGDGLNVPVDEDISVDEQLAKVTKEWPLPLLMRLGIKNDVYGGSSEYYPNEKHRVTLTMDGINPIDFSVYGGLGCEYAWREIVFARSGLHLAHDTAGLSLGGGLQYRTRGFHLAVDYAWVDYGILEQSHQFGLTLGF